MVSKLDTTASPAAEDIDSTGGLSPCTADSPSSINSLILPNSWALYYKINSKNKADHDWKKDQRLVHQFNSVEEFWRLFNNIRTLKELSDSEMSLCHQGTFLAWEDPQYEQGGRWMVSIPDGYISDKNMPRLDAFWQYLALGAIGEQLGGATGVSASIRRSFSKVSIWMDSTLCANVESVRTVGRAIARLIAMLVGADEIMTIKFEPFGTGSPLSKLVASVSQRGIEGDFKVESVDAVMHSARR